MLEISRAHEADLDVKFMYLHTDYAMRIFRRYAAVSEKEIAVFTWETYLDGYLLGGGYKKEHINDFLYLYCKTIKDIQKKIRKIKKKYIRRIGIKEPLELDIKIYSPEKITQLCEDASDKIKLLEESYKNKKYFNRDHWNAIERECVLAINELSEVFENIRRSFPEFRKYRDGRLAFWVSIIGIGVGAAATILSALIAKDVFFGSNGDDQPHDHDQIYGRLDTHRSLIDENIGKIFVIESDLIEIQKVQGEIQITLDKKAEKISVEKNQSDIAEHEIEISEIRIAANDNGSRLDSLDALNLDDRILKNYSYVQENQSDIAHNQRGILDVEGRVERVSDKLDSAKIKGAEVVLFRSLPLQEEIVPFNMEVTIQKVDRNQVRGVVFKDKDTLQEFEEQVMLLNIPYAIEVGHNTYTVILHSAGDFGANSDDPYVDMIIQEEKGLQFLKQASEM